MEAPVLRDGDLVLRAPTAADVPAVVEMCSDAAVQRWVPTVPVPYAAADALAWLRSTEEGWRRGDSLGLAVEVAGRFAGSVRLRVDGAGAADVGYALAPSARGRGTAATAVRLLLSWGFAELGLQVVHWGAAVGNWPSRRVAWACGFAVEGTLRDWLPDRGERRDAWLGSLRWDEPMRPRSRWLEPVALRGPGVRLGPHRADDVPRVAEACADAVTQHWLPSLPSPYTVLDAAAHVAGREEQHALGAGVYWAVRPDATGADGAAGASGAPGDQRLLAEVGLFRLDGPAPHGGAGHAGRSGEVGYWCHPDARGRGVAVAAVAAVAAHALAPPERGGLGLSRLLLRAADGNTASQKVAVRAGFTRTGVDRAAEAMRDGSVRDLLRYDLLADEVG